VETAPIERPPLSPGASGGSGSGRGHGNGPNEVSNALWDEWD